jgi:adenylate cyclase
VSAQSSIERERKFLPDPASPELRDALAACIPEQRIAIRQGYILRAGDAGELRLRETITAGSGRRVMTVKRGAMPERLEAEVELSATQWNQLLPLLAGLEIRKERFLVEVDPAGAAADGDGGPEDGGTAGGATEQSTAAPLGRARPLVAEIDRFDAPDPGLVLIEVEFPSRTALDAFIPPPWFGREVTGDARYRNQNLASDDPA